MIREDSYYLQISSAALAHYFAKAIILPTSYYANRISDIQGINGNLILLSKKKWSIKNDCSVEILLTKDEARELLPTSRNYYYYPNPIPISRVKAIHFLDENQAKTTVWNINTGAAWVPSYLINIGAKNEEDLTSDNELSDISERMPVNDLARKAKYYDHLLGGVAFMRLGGEIEENYSTNYFPTLAFFNQLIRKDYEKASGNSVTDATKNYSGLFAANGSTQNRFRSYIYQNVGSEEVDTLASLEGIRIGRKYGILELESIKKESMVYDLAVLSLYGQGKSKNVETLVGDLYNGNIPNNKKEEIALLFGLNNGYTSLRNKYKVAKEEKYVKFELNSKLDFYIIESVYQYAFNGKKELAHFEYLDGIYPEQEEKQVRKGAYTILGKPIFTKKKQQASSRGYSEEYLQSNFPYEICSVIYDMIKDWLPPFAHPIKEEGEKFIKERIEKVLTSWTQAYSEKFEIDIQANLQVEQNIINRNQIDEIQILKDKIAIMEKEADQLRSRMSNLPQENAGPSNEYYPEHLIQDSMVRETTVEEVPEQNLDLYKLSVHQLQQRVKDLHISPVPKKKEKLIELLKSTKTML